MFLAVNNKNNVLEPMFKNNFMNEILLTTNLRGYPTFTPRIHFEVKKLYVLSFILLIFYFNLKYYLQNSCYYSSY